MMLQNQIIAVIVNEACDRSFAWLEYKIQSGCSKEVVSTDQNLLDCHDIAATNEPSAIDEVMKSRAHQVHLTISIVWQQCTIIEVALPTIF